MEILVVNGEKYWDTYFPQDRVIRVNIRQTYWTLTDKLTVYSEGIIIRPDIILWRVGAINPSPQDLIVMNMIQLSGVYCFNSIECLLKGYDRLSMLYHLRMQDLPVIPHKVYSDTKIFQRISLNKYPYVIKYGNLHGGYGKMLIENYDHLQHAKSLLYGRISYVCIERFINYVRDIRYLAVGDNTYAMVRKSSGWKANVDTTDHYPITVDQTLASNIQTFRQYLGAEVVALDILEDDQGNLIVLEYNDIPGFTGFSKEAKQDFVDIVNNRTR